MQWGCYNANIFLFLFFLHTHISFRGDTWRVYVIFCFEHHGAQAPFEERGAWHIYATPHMSPFEEVLGAYAYIYIYATPQLIAQVDLLWRRETAGRHGTEKQLQKSFEREHHSTGGPANSENFFERWARS